MSNDVEARIKRLEKQLKSNCTKDQQKEIKKKIERLRRYWGGVCDLEQEVIFLAKGVMAFIMMVILIFALVEMYRMAWGDKSCRKVYK